MSFMTYKFIFDPFRNLECSQRLLGGLLETQEASAPTIVTSWAGEEYDANSINMIYKTQSLSQINIKSKNFFYKSYSVWYAI